MKQKELFTAEAQDFAGESIRLTADPKWLAQRKAEPELAALEARAAAGDDLGQVLRDAQRFSGWFASKATLRGAANYAITCKALKMARITGQVAQGGKR